MSRSLKVQNGDGPNYLHSSLFCALMHQHIYQRLTFA